jgi:hypothetical protein
MHREKSMKNSRKDERINALIDPGSDLSTINTSYVKNHMIENSITPHMINKINPLSISKLLNRVKKKMGS